MTAQVQFFCTPAEEREVLRYLTQPEGTRVYDVAEGKLRSWDAFSAFEVPDYSAPLSLYIHQPAHGSLVWHTSQPNVAGPTHNSFVMNFLARQAWDDQKLVAGDRMIDTDLSPIISYHRGTVFEGRAGQNCVLAPPSNLQRVGPEYERWVKRALAWIRRRGTIVHDYRKQSATISNPHSIVSTIYGFAGVLNDIESNTHQFVILI